MILVIPSLKDFDQRPIIIDDEHTTKLPRIDKSNQMK